MKNSSIRAFLLTVLLLCPVGAYSEMDLSDVVPPDAKIVEVWECRDFLGSWSEVLAVASIFEGGQIGKIEVAGTAHVTQYNVDGFDRRWDFGLQEDGSFRYSFIVSPNGRASYYDFRSSSKSVKPSITMDCRHRKG